MSFHCVNVTYILCSSWADTIIALDVAYRLVCTKTLPKPMVSNRIDSSNNYFEVMISRVAAIFILGEVS